MSSKCVTECPVSLSKDRFSYLKLGDMPLVNRLCRTKEESLNCQRFPLTVDYYPKSGLSMLSTVVDPKLLFTNYPYKSATNKPYIHHCLEMFDYIKKFCPIDDRSRILDIGGNDGTLLSAFKEKDKTLELINVDPCADFQKECNEKNISFINALFDANIATCMRKVRVVTSTNVFQHTKDIKNFAIGVSQVLDNEGIWCLEFPYWKKDLETQQYDQIYHEHIYYYTVTPLFNLFRQIGLEIIDIEECNIHGGTIRLIIKKGCSRVNDKVFKYLVEEENLSPDYYKRFSKRIEDHIDRCREKLLELKYHGTICAFGAAAKGCTFLNTTGIDYCEIDYIIDDTEIKQGKYMPGTGIQIVSRDILKAYKPDYMLILAHNFSDYIKQSISNQYTGKFVKMFPEPIVYE